ncbi:MAG: CRISPR-associated protein Cas5 [Gemmatimonadales bacterium]
MTASHTARDYGVSFEVAGPLAMFTRPDTGAAPTSYPIPTRSAVKGLFESIAFLSDGAAWISPVAVEVCRHVGESGGRVRFQKYTTNYGGPLRKSDLFKKGVVVGGSSMQLFATVLSDVCYRLHGVVVGTKESGPINKRHYLQHLFDRRLCQGRCFRTPCLGWSEFTCSYWGPFRQGVTELDDALSLDVPSMLLGVWDTPTSGRYAPEFRQDVKVTNGVLQYDTSSCQVGIPTSEGR